MKTTQQQLDQIYSEGKSAYLRDVGTHGPTFKPPSLVKTPNPYPPKTKQHQAWQAGYYQSTRRVIA